MKAMILAAGLGTRLKPLTDSRPKALVEVEGVTMLERVIGRLRGQGFDRITVNAHHFSEMVKDFIRSRDFGVEVKVSDESGELLDTGGGLVKARELLFSDEGPVLVHNVDIISNADLRGLMEAHKKDDRKATLLVSDRDSTRKLVFDGDMTLRGWHDLKSGRMRPDGFQPEEGMKELAFSGIYVIEKDCIEEMRQKIREPRFPVMDYFLMPGRDCRVKGESGEDLKLLDIGKPATLSQASQILKDLDNDY